MQEVIWHQIYQSSVEGNNCYRSGLNLNEISQIFFHYDRYDQQEQVNLLNCPGGLLKKFVLTFITDNDFCFEYFALCKVFEIYAKKDHLCRLCKYTKLCQTIKSKDHAVPKGRAA